MFHPHVAEFTELDWMGFFKVVEPEDYDAALKEAGVDARWDQLGMNGSTARRTV